MTGAIGPAPPALNCEKRERSCLLLLHIVAEINQKESLQLNLDVGMG